MSVVKVIEIVCEGSSIEAALESGIQEASKTLKNIKQVDIKWVHAKVDNGKIAGYRVNAKVSFIVEH